MSEIILTLPAWIDGILPDQNTTFQTPEKRMAFVIRLSQLNVEYGTGGPFGAAIFELQTGRLIAPGVNLVVPANCSIAHAEMMAIMLAQKQLGVFDLGGDGMPAYELTASTEPCAMCFGAIPWSGVRQLTCGARDEDARSIGFDEGPKLAYWHQALEDRGIQVQRDICRTEAAAVLKSYLDKHGLVYNGRSFHQTA